VAREVGAASTADRRVMSASMLLDVDKLSFKVVGKARAVVMIR